MTSPEMAKLKERPIRNQLRIELSNPEALLSALTHNQQEHNKIFQSTLGIGSLYAVCGLFSRITVQANTVQNAYLLRGGYDITVNLKYNDLNTQHWSEKQIKQLISLLKRDYQEADIRDRTNKSNHSQVIIGLSKKVYVVDLGYESERTAYENQVERDSRAFLDGAPLRRFMTARYPIPIDSSITINPIDTDVDVDYSRSLFTTPTADQLISNTQTVGKFTDTTSQWMWHLQDFVNAMAKVKGIPQPGTLTLLPPQDLPKFKK